MSDAELRHYRYIGETEHVMPALATRPRCCQEHNQHAHDGETVTMHFASGEDADPDHPLEAVSVIPQVLLRPGDVILLDVYSGEGRADFEPVDGPAKGLEDMTKAELTSYAAAKGFEIPKGGTKPEILEAVHQAQAEALAAAEGVDTEEANP